MCRGLWFGMNTQAISLRQTAFTVVVFLFCFARLQYSLFVLLPFVHYSRLSTTRTTPLRAIKLSGSVSLSISLWRPLLGPGYVAPCACELLSYWWWLWLPHTVIQEFFGSEFSHFVLFVHYISVNILPSWKKITKIISRKLIVPWKRNGIGKIWHSKLYKPQTKNCTIRTHKKFCTYVLCTIRHFYREFYILYICIYRNLISINLSAYE